MQRFCELVGLPVRTFYDRRARHHADQDQPRGPWPTPAQDRVCEAVIEMALAFPMWGHRKIAWLCRHDGTEVSDATCLRVLRKAGLVLPVDYVAERRDLARARREAFVAVPTRRNQVWQTDFFELETSGGGTWRSGDVIDYARKLVLAGPVTATQTARDAINAIENARCHVHDLLGRPLVDDVTHPDTGQITPVIIVSDNGPCYKSSRFARYIASRPELTHVRTRRQEPTDQRHHRALPRRHPDRAPLARAAGRRRAADDRGRALPPPLQHGPPARSARRRPPDRTRPRRPRHARLRPARRTTPNAPNHADSLTRDTYRFAQLSYHQSRASRMNFRLVGLAP